MISPFTVVVSCVFIRPGVLSLVLSFLSIFSLLTSGKKKRKKQGKGKNNLMLACIILAVALHTREKNKKKKRQNLFDLYDVLVLVFCIRIVLEGILFFFLKFIFCSHMYAYKN